MPESSLQSALGHLERHWGYQSFRPGQWDAIRSVLSGRDALVVFPTGGGKSLCYQLPALMLEGITVVISPLIALMQDQVAGLRARGIEATFINSALERREIERRWTDVEFGRYRLVYCAPERLQSDVFVARASRMKVDLLAVDEAHCVSEWGPHFRPAYLQIGEARELLGNPVTIAVTASATPEVRKDIVNRLRLRDPVWWVHGFDRPNITFSAFDSDNKRAKVLEVLQALPGSGLVYAGTRRRTEEWAEWLRSQDVLAEAYHGGMDPEVRQGIADRWLSGERRVVVATNAFGMGIDKADVRFVIHVDLPLSLEAYYQEAGRAGRDGLRSHAVLVTNEQDEALPLRLIEESHPDRKLVQQVYRAVGELAQIPLGVLPDGPVTIHEPTVSRLLKTSPARVASAVDLLIRQGTWQRWMDRTDQGQLRFEGTPDTLRAFADGCDNRALAHFVEALLRAVPGDAFRGWSEVDLRSLSRRLDLPKERLERGFGWLQNHGYATWQPPGESRRVLFVEARTRTISVDDLDVQRARRQSLRRFRHLLRYRQAVGCRRRVLMAYFGEWTKVPCGRCDVCLGRHRPLVVTPDEEPLLRRLLEEIRDGVEPDVYLESSGVSPGRVESLVAWLIREGYVGYADVLDGAPRLAEKAEAFLGRRRTGGEA